MSKVPAKKYPQRAHPHECHCVHVEFRFEWMEDKIEQLQELIKKQTVQIKKLEDTMAQTMQDVQDAVTAVTATVDGLKTSVDALIAKGAVDTTPIVEALGAVNTALSGLKDAVDAAVAA